jgi:hypothetical protein
MVVIKSVKVVGTVFNHGTAFPSECSTKARAIGPRSTVNDTYRIRFSGKYSFSSFPTGASVRCVICILGISRRIQLEAMTYLKCSSKADSSAGGKEVEKMLYKATSGLCSIP